MRKRICKIIVYLFIVLFLGIIYLFFSLKDKEATLIVLSSFGSFCIGGYTLKFVDWLFEDREYLIGN